MSFKKRSKSLKHKTIEISIERIFEEYDEGRIERIELEIETYSSNNSKNMLEHISRQVGFSKLLGKNKK